MHHGNAHLNEAELAGKRAENFRRGRIFGRYFDHTPLQPSELALAWLGRPSGVMLAAEQRNNDAVPAGFTFFGQFIDHDVTLMVQAPSIGQPHNLARLRNMREPALNLDSVYGAGPGPNSESAAFYDEQFKFRLAPHEFDLPRDANDVAQIGDGRNDENHIVSQLHLAFLRLHNALMDKDGRYTREAFDEVRETVIHHYQHYVLNEYVPLHTPKVVFSQVVSNDFGLYDELIVKADGHLVMPIEFAGAAFRHGHSQVRGGYAINANFGAQLFNPNAGVDLNGGRQRPVAHAVDWALFFSDSAPSTRPAAFNASQLVDGELAGPLFALRPPAIVDAPISLAERNLRRGRDLGLIDGRSAVRAMQARGLQAEILADDDLKLPAVLTEPFVIRPNDNEEFADPRERPPLWFYLLREAEVHRAKELAAGTPAEQIAAMGPLGGALIAETLVGLLRNDRGTQTSPNLPPIKAIPVDGSFQPRSEISTLAKMTAFASPFPT